MSTDPSKEFGKWPWPVFTVPAVREYDNFILTRAQSILTMNGSVGPLLPLNHAFDVIRWHENNLGKDL